MHRLDRLTSGVLILAKNNKTTLSFQEHLKENKVKKKYYARVKGKFEKEITVNMPIYCKSAKKGI